MSLKDEFIRIKHKIQKQYPGASVKRDRFGKFYIVDGNGYKILQDALSNGYRNRERNCFYPTQKECKAVSRN